MAHVKYASSMRVGAKAIIAVVIAEVAGVSDAERLLNLPIVPLLSCGQQL